MKCFVLLCTMVLSTCSVSGYDRPPPGAPSDRSVDDPQVQKYLPDAIKALKGMFNVNKKCYKPKIESAKYQIVAGFVIHYEISFHPTTCSGNCDKKSADELDQCPTDPNDDNGALCHASVYVRPWEDQREVNGLRCSL